MTTSLASILHSLLLCAIVPAAMLIAGCEKHLYQRPDDRWPDRPEVSVAADSALMELFQEISPGIDNVDSTLRLSVTFLPPEELPSRVNGKGGFGIVLYGVLPGNSTGLLPAATGLKEVAEGSPVLVGGDPLVLLAAAGSPLAAEAPVKLADARFATVATIDPQRPEGSLTATTLRRLGLADTLAGRLLTAGNERDLIDMLTSGKAAIGIMAGSDARRFEGRVTVVDTLSLRTADSGVREIPSIRYYALMLRSAADSGAAARMMAWLVNPDIQRAFNHYGFLRRDSLMASDRAMRSIGLDIDVTRRED